MKTIATEDIVRIAESWIGTPFIWGIALKGRGVDCARFIFSVYKEAGIIPTNDSPPVIPKFWTESRLEKIPADFFEQQILKYAVKIHFDEKQIGDVISFVYRGYESHLAILVEDDCIIHAVTGNKVVKERLRSWPNVKSVYRWKGFA